MEIVIHIYAHFSKKVQKINIFNAHTIYETDLTCCFNVNMFLKLMSILFDRAKLASYLYKFFYIRN